jgi:hypothetical protein
MKNYSIFKFRSGFNPQKTRTAIHGRLIIAVLKIKDFSLS